MSPPVRHWLVPPDIQAPNMKGDGETDVGQGNNDCHTELLHQHPDQTSLEQSTLETTIKKEHYICIYTY